MERLFAFEIENIFSELCKMNFIDLALLYSCGNEKPFTEKIYFWEIDLEKLFVLHFKQNLGRNFIFLGNRFGPTIVSRD